jgi:hypothetical protein
MRFCLLIAVATWAGCKKSAPEKQPPPPRPIDAAVEVTPTPDAAAAVDETMAKKAGNCPSTVVGAVTTVSGAGSDGRIVLDITSADAGAVPAIRLRAAHLVDVQGAPPGSVQHTGEGTGGGDAGVCPVIVRDSRLEMAEIDGGVRVTIWPADRDAGGRLRAEIDARIEKARAWTAAHIKQTGEHGGLGGDGGGRGGHGANRSGKGDASGPRDRPDAGADAPP